MKAESSRKAHGLLPPLLDFSHTSLLAVPGIRWAPPTSGPLHWLSPGLLFLHCPHSSLSHLLEAFAEVSTPPHPRPLSMLSHPFPALCFPFPLPTVKHAACSAYLLVFYLSPLQDCKLHDYRDFLKKSVLFTTVVQGLRTESGILQVLSDYSLHNERTRGGGSGCTVA